MCDCKPDDPENNVIVMLHHATGDGYTHVGVDPCIAPIIAALNDAECQTVASCCGHNHQPGSIALEDGRWVVILKDHADYLKVAALFPDTHGEVWGGAEPRTMTDVRNDPGHIRSIAKGLKIIIDTEESCPIVEEAYAMAQCNADEIEKLEGLLLNLLNLNQETSRELFNLKSEGGPLEKMSAALEWYEQEAIGAAKYMVEKTDNPEALLAILTVLANDDGGRARNALSTIAVKKGNSNAE